MALNLKDRDDKGQDTIKKNGRIGRGPPAFYSVAAQLYKILEGLHMAFEKKDFHNEITTTFDSVPFL